MAKEIPLTQGKVAIVDDADFEWLSQWKWCYHRDRAGRGIADGKGSAKMHFMHNYIMQPPPGFVVDHIDNDPLNNQRSNLRICTQAENLRNRRGFSTKSSTSFKGVFPVKKSKIRPWRATIKLNGKSIHLGSFPTAEAAAIAYNEAALKYHGEFAHLNIIEQP